jgi:hypothetical protein
MGSIYELLDRIEATEVLPRSVAVPPGATPLEFLRSVYTDPDVPLPLRVRAAVEAAPFAHPKLSAIFDVGSSFAAKLEEAIKRSEALAKPEGD